MLKLIRRMNYKLGSRRFVSPLISSTRGLFIHPQPDYIPQITMAEIMNTFAREVGAVSEYTPAGIQEAIEKRRKLTDLLPRDRNELPPRKMEESFVSAIIPIKSDLELRERYVTFFGTVRVGRLLEDLDIFAVYSCYKHILNPKSQGHPNPYSVVTALVDSIHFSGVTIKTNEDIRLCGHVSWVGKSSMEVSVLIDQKDENGDWVKLTNAVFVMVARDPLNQGAAIINPLITQNEGERQFLLQGEERSRKRRNAEDLSIRKPPNEEERGIIHQLYLDNLDDRYEGFRRKVLPVNSKLMEDCKLNTLLLCHPQYRNRFNKIFGGFIMRQAFELAFANVYMYTRKRPSILNIDDILFKKPVEIGSLLRFSATIGYVEGEYVHIPVIAEVLNPENGQRDVTNVFHFTFHGGEDLSTLIPNTYQESMLYLEARRHFKDMMKHQGSNFN